MDAHIDQGKQNWVLGKWENRLQAAYPLLCRQLGTVGDCSTVEECQWAQAHPLSTSMSLTAKCSATVAHCPRSIIRSSRCASSSASQPLRRGQQQPQAPSSRSSSKKQGSRCSALRVAAMAATTEAKSVSGTMAELKKQGK